MYTLQSDSKTFANFWPPFLFLKQTRVPFCSLVTILAAFTFTVYQRQLIYANVLSRLIKTVNEHFAPYSIWRSESSPLFSVSDTNGTISIRIS